MTAHHKVHSGLREHSVGSLYPVIITHYGDGSSGVMLGSEELRGVSRDLAREIAEFTKLVHTQSGYNAACSYLAAHMVE